MSVCTQAHPCTRAERYSRLPYSCEHSCLSSYGRFEYLKIQRFCRQLEVGLYVHSPPNTDLTSYYYYYNESQGQLVFSNSDGATVFRILVTGEQQQPAFFFFFLALYLISKGSHNPHPGLSVLHITLLFSVEAAMNSVRTKGLCPNNTLLTDMAVWIWSLHLYLLTSFLGGGEHKPGGFRTLREGHSQRPAAPVTVGCYVVINGAPSSFVPT